MAMDNLFVAEETPDVSESPSPSGLLASGLAQTRASRSASAAVPPSGLGLVLSSSASKGSDPPSLTAPFEDKSGPAGLAALAASAPGRSGLAGPAPSIQGISVGQALVAVVRAAMDRDEDEDKAVGALALTKPAASYCLRVSEADAEEPDEGVTETKVFGSCGAPLTGPWTPDLDFPPLDPAATLSSIGISTFVVTEAGAAEGDGGLTTLEVVSGEEDGPDGPSDERITAAASSSVAPPTAAPAPGPWAGSGGAPVLRVRLPPSSVASHAGELRSGRGAIRLVVERPSADGSRLAARFTVSVEPPSAPGTPATDAPSAEELASSLMSGLVLVPQE